MTRSFPLSAIDRAGEQCIDEGKALVTVDRPGLKGVIAMTFYATTREMPIVRGDGGDLLVTEDEPKE